jgi:hypothetical protein
LFFNNLSKFICLTTCLSFLFACTNIKVVTSLDEITQKRINNTFLLKKGKYLFQGTILVPSNTQIIGNKTTLLISKNTKFPIFAINSAKDVTIQNLVFQGEKLKADTNAATLLKYNYQFTIETNNAENVLFKKCAFSNTYGTVIHISDTKNTIIDKCNFKDIGITTQGDGNYSYDAIIIGGYKHTENIEVKNCTFENIGTNFPRKNPLWANDGDGVHIQSHQIIRNINIHHNQFTRCAARGVKLQSGEQIKIFQNQFEECGSAVNLALATDVSDVTIDNNNLKKCRLSFGTDCGGGIYKRKVNNLNITNNTVDSCLHFMRTSGYSTIYNSTISGNKVQNTGTFFFEGRIINGTIQDNVVENYATANDKSNTHIIYISPESDNLNIQNNSFQKSKFATKTIENFSKNKILIEKNKIREVKQ